MERDPEERADLRLRHPWARTVVCCTLSYAVSGTAHEEGAREGRGRISRYAWGRDYHKGMRRRLRRACELLKASGATETRPHVDSGPLLERSLHQAAGTGWIGKNCCLIDRELGSWTFLGEVVTDLELPFDAPATDHCGSCTACLEACPTGAFVAPGMLDSGLCISYQTIESRGPAPEGLRGGIGNHLFGCDVCQEVCPWNSTIPLPDRAEFRPRPGIAAPELGGLASLGEREFHERFAGTAVRRASYEGFLRNVCVALGNESAPGAGRALEALVRHPSELVREHAAWARDRIRKGETSRA